MKNLAIIPARGGSKRIPRKNVKIFLGKPIIAYSIEAALDSGLFDEVMVSTDDEEIADVAIKYGAKVPVLRSKNTSDDFATLADVMEEVVEYYKGEQKIYDSCCCILPTAPLLKFSTLKEGFDLLVSNNFDSVKPIVQFSYPIQRALKFNEGTVEMINPELLRTRSQDLEAAYYDAGQFYWFRPQVGLSGTKKGAIVISEKFVQDIDTLEDWELAELKYKFLFQEK
ncbi:pseudaminic acid cytidylyltransferase [Marinifilum fragile]|uniref:pseudaminic acid cytidylyltransferase n=1 Tax=Marinifilum fragile TaxID=570161 RepID=UPI002AA8267F|nr:pseudaminic acid cytidylyltransferase [Marinifilum fragile]